MHIIAGQFKGRRLLPPPKGAATRPVTALAKKSLFDALGGLVDGAAVVDLYCGAGTLGLEALSRGAASCCFADRDARVLQRLRRNIEAVGAADRCIVWRGDVVRRLRSWLAQVAGPVDLAFVDPPYAAARHWSWPSAAATIFSPLGERLSPSGRVVLRLPWGVEVPARVGGLMPRRRKRHGEMAVVVLGVSGGAD